MLICARCGQEKYQFHSEEVPHASVPLEPPLSEVPCEGYVPGWGCTNPADQCAPYSDCELHEEAEPHVRKLNDQEVCPGADWPGRPSGGGGFGGGGASGGW